MFANAGQAYVNIGRMYVCISQYVDQPEQNNFLEEKLMTKTSKKKAKYILNLKKFHLLVPTEVY